jgi:signal transduction histidine kinase/CheY-like chemotaxis protein
MAGQDGRTLSDLLARERRARLAAERLLDQKSRELSAANRKLSDHARLLSDEVVVKRREVLEVRSKAEELKGENSQVREDLERANVQVVKAERRLWDALETIQDGFAVFNARDQLIMANRAYMRMFEGLDSIPPGSRYPDILTLLSEEGLVDIGFEAAETWVAKMLARWQSDPIEPVVMKLWDETYIKLLDRRTGDGDLVSLALDITETIRYEDTLKAERVRAESANRAKSAFLANMSHEIRTPMNGVVGMADLLCDTPLTEEQRLYAETIKSSGESLLVIINDVLDYSKIEAAKLTLHPELFDFERTIHEVLLLLKPSAQEKGIDLIVDYDMFLPTCFTADPGRMRQIMTNLVGNAVKFTGEGHVLVRVTGVPEQDPTGYQSLHVTVEDTGIGIPADKVDHIFGEFNQVEDERNRKYEGTGLGLAITKQLIELMEGEIWVESEEGAGACFGFRLTLPTEERIGSETRPVPGMRRALVVDEQQINRLVLEKQLAMMGLEVTLRRSFAEAQQHSLTGFDLVLADHRPPESDGIALARAVRAADPDVPIILLAQSPSSLGTNAATAGVTAVLQKPLLRRDLYDCIGGLAGDATPPQPEPTRTAAAKADPALRTMRVLAAEDNKTNRLVFGKMVQDLDIDLTFAENGLQALEAYDAERPDLIFMDISMPEMDGKEASRNIREREVASGTDHVPICALTAHAMAGDDAEILAAGIDHYLTKPLRKATITDMIRRHAPQDVRPPVATSDAAAAPPSAAPAPPV